MKTKTRTPKSLLESLWNEAKFGPYYEVATAIRIAEEISLEHGAIPGDYEANQGHF